MSRVMPKRRARSMKESALGSRKMWETCRNEMPSGRCRSGQQEMPDKSEVYLRSSICQILLQFSLCDLFIIPSSSASSLEAMYISLMPL